MLYWILLKKNLKRELANRANFFTFLSVNLVGYTGNLLFYILIYQFVDDINGWTKYHMLILAATIWIVDSLNGGMFHMNVIRIPRYVQTYDLDFFLLKPIPSRWYTSTKFISFGLLSGIPFGIFLIIFSIIKLKIHVSFMQACIYCLCIFAATLIMHDLFFIVIILSIKYIKISALIDLCWDFLNLGKYPENIYPNSIRKLFTFIIPALVIYNYPTIFLLDSNFYKLFILILLTIILTFLTTLLWHYFMKFYYA